VVTHRAVAATPDEDVLDLAAAPVWGLVRAAQTEHPGRFALIDVDDPAAVPPAPATDRAVLAIRGGIAYTPRLAPSGAPVTDAPDLTGATVLITGGTGALGRLVARHLACGHGVRRLVLVSRSGGTAADVDTGSEAEVEVVACDVADPRQVEDLFAGRDIDAVVHAAGVLDDATVEAMADAHVHRVLAPKADGAWHLHRATLARPLRAFVLFSSAAGLLGNAGQANYAAGSTFLDALAAHRRAEGLPATSLAWGPWTTGMAAGTGRMGGGELTRMAAQDALSLLDAALATDRAVLAPLTPNMAAMRERAAGGLLSDTLRDLVPAPRADDVTPRSAAERVTDRLAALRNPAERAALVADLVAEHVAAVLGLPADQVRPRSAFKDIGFDSLAAVELRNRITASTGVRLPSTAVFDFPTPAALITELTARLAPEPSQDAELDTDLEPDLDAELDRLAERLTELRGDTERGVAVRDRLHRLAESLDPGGGIGDASLEQVFAFIDAELGRQTTEGGAPA
jgi:NAD(P)-dependent dehydrogenase (short-subunit alcohol dehydrogenase family)/acyl carrier protein